MRLPGDTACFVELTGVSVLPSAEDADQRPFRKGASASVTCAAVGAGGAWSVVVRGGGLDRPLGPGDRAVVTGLHAVTGDRFAVPVVLECTEVGATARFEVPRPRPARARWGMAG